MEGPVKERLTGALILVAALVIIVPEMLSGPDAKQAATLVPAAQPAEAGAPLRTYSMVLNDSADARVSQQGALNPQPATPAPAAPQPPEPQATLAESSAELTPPRAMPSPASPSTAALPSAPPSPRDAPSAGAAPREAPPVSAQPGGSWWTQLGSYSSRDNANRLAQQLRAAGYAMDVSKVSAGGKELYRVRAGPVRSRADAQSLQARLASAGHKSVLVAP